MGDKKDEEISKLRSELGMQLTCAERLRRPEGIPTGLPALDSFLLWNGFPKGALSALCGDLGLGATSLWVGAAAHVTRRGRWAAWVDREAQLFPLPLWQNRLDLSRLLAIEAPESETKFLWLLQELMASTLFDLIGCDLGQVRLRDHQLRKLETLARSYQTAVVFFAGRERVRNPSLFALVVGFSERHLRVERALHRPTPHLIPRRINHEITPRSGPNSDSDTRQELEPRSLPDPAAGLARFGAPDSGPGTTTRAPVAAPGGKSGQIPPVTGKGFD